MIPNEKKLLELLSNNDVTFFIPPYQRNYEWTNEQCKVFLSDIQKTQELNDSGMNAEHFFGTITFFQTEVAFGQPSKLVLIDGQQRITTTMLFLIALRDISSDKGMKNFIDSKYLKNNSVQDDTEYKIKLKQVETDWEAYRKLVLSEELTDNEKNSAVCSNYRFFYNKLLEYVEGNGNLGAMIEKGLNRFSVVTIQLEPDKKAWENPQEIFESMNSLGKPLSLADLVRNYLLLGLKPEKQDDLYRKYWLHIEREVPGHVSDFIRDYMQGHEKKPFLKATESNYKELYGLFKQIFVNHKTDELLKDLSENATVYKYIINGSGTGNKAVDGELRDLNTMAVTTSQSFLMVLLKAWKDNQFIADDISNILHAFKVYCMRRRILGITQAENKNFPLLANHIGRLASASDKGNEMFKILSGQENALRLPNDNELARYIEGMDFYHFKHAKFCLALIEEKITKSRPSLNDEKLQIEHIMPRTLNDAWKEALGSNYEDIHTEWLNNIGNLTLIRHNQELGNKSFEEKKQIYINNAGLQIAKTEIINNHAWDEDSIKTRTKWIIGYLLKEVLVIPDSMRHRNNYRIQSGKHLSFQELMIVGENINFIADPSIIARVVNDKEVEFEGKKWRLSPLTKEIQKRRGALSPSGSYSGALYWEYDGMKLSDII